VEPHDLQSRSKVATLYRGHYHLVFELTVFLSRVSESIYRLRRARRDFVCVVSGGISMRHNATQHQQNNHSTSYFDSDTGTSLCTFQPLLSGPTTHASGLCTQDSGRCIPLAFTGRPQAMEEYKVAIAACTKKKSAEQPGEPRGSLKRYLRQRWLSISLYVYCRPVCWHNNCHSHYHAELGIVSR
jgi:hypothetical protein